MMHLHQTIASISALLFSFAILCLGHGLQNTLLGMRATLEGYPTWVTGLMMSGYFCGFILGTWFSSQLIPKVGHIRVFIAMASMASSISLMHALFVNPVSWVALRFAYGVLTAGLYMAIESWLNLLGTRATRGRILSVYMIINFSCLALGQSFLTLADPRDFTLFAVSSILLSFALVPLILSNKVRVPKHESFSSFSLARLYQTSPLAVVGCVATGMAGGAFFGLAAVYLTGYGIAANQIALFISLTFIGGLLFQWPMGVLSDRINRRYVIAIACVASLLVSLGIGYLSQGSQLQLDARLFILALLFGGFTYPQYSLYVALANDFLKPEFFVKASAGLLTCNGIGAIFGPLLASLMMEAKGPSGLFTFLIIVFALLTIFTLLRILSGRRIPESTSEKFVSLPKTSVGLFPMDPRFEEKE